MSQGAIVRVIVGTTDRPPDPFGVPYQRSVYALLKELRRQGHRVSFWGIASSDRDALAARRVADELHIDIHVHAPVLPGPRRWRSKLQTARRPFFGCVPPALHQELRQECARGYDILHLENLQWGGYLGLDMARAVVSVHSLSYVDYRGVPWHSFGSVKDRVLAGVTERRLLRQYRWIRAITSDLADETRRINPAARLHTVPIAVEAERYPTVEDSGGGDVVGLIGAMKYPKSRQGAIRLLTSIFPRVRRRLPGARLLIAGFGAHDALADHLETPGVTVLQDLEDAGRFFRQCTVFAYPLTNGSGIMTKNVEAMLYGVPVVTTTAGASGLDLESGLHAYVEDDDDVFAERVVELLTDAGRRRRMAREARALVETAYHPALVVSRLQDMYARMLAS